MTDLQFALYLDMVVARLDAAYDALNDAAPADQMKKDELSHLGTRRCWPPIEPLRDVLDDLRHHAQQLKEARGAPDG